MSNRSASRTPSNDAELSRTERLHRVSIQLEAVLQPLDLEDEPQLAEEVATAIQAVERAREIEDTAGMSTTDPDGFVFRLE
jgi:hypothetical protein